LRKDLPEDQKQHGSHWPFRLQHDCEAPREAFVIMKGAPHATGACRERYGPAVAGWAESATAGRRGTRVGGWCTEGETPTAGLALLRGFGKAPGYGGAGR
jgi:hypothetical protein